MKQEKHLSTLNKSIRVLSLLIGLFILTVFLHYMGWRVAAVSAMALLIITSLIILRLIIAAVVLTYRLLFSGIIEKPYSTTKKDK